MDKVQGVRGKETLGLLVLGQMSGEKPLIRLTGCHGDEKPQATTGYGHLGFGFGLSAGMRMDGPFRGPGHMKGEVRAAKALEFPQMS